MHKNPDCDGKWIDITTLSDKSPVVVCGKCRAVVRGAEAIDAISAEDDPTPPKPQRDGIWIAAWIGMVLTVALGVATIVMTWMAKH